MPRLTDITFVISTILLFSPAFSYAESHSSYIADFGCVGGKYGLHLPKQLSAVLKLAKAQKIEAGDVENWSDGYTTKRNYLQSPGLELVYISFSNDTDRYMVVSAEISNSSWRKLSPFLIGSSIDTARQKLKPFSENDQSLTSSYGSEAGDVRFETKNGVIRKIIYSCYTG